ncbi:MAG: amidohydrolase family protein [Actinomycetota bacterium]|nr:amidohydrolase family protein [Actinomycetota bacterium]
MTSPIAIHTATVVLPITAPPILNGAVAVQDGHILGVGARAELGGRFPGASHTHWDGVLMPGLINAHTHLNYCHAAHLYDNGKPFPEWIQDMPPIIAATTPEQWQASAEQGIALMLATGTTAAADVVTGASALAAQYDAGLAGVSYFEVVLADGPRWVGIRPDFLATLDAAPPSGIGISPHSPYTLDTSVLADLGNIARARGIRLHPHGAEQSDEVAFVAAGTGMFADWATIGGLGLALLDGGSGRTPIAELDSVRLLGADSHIAHGVHADAADRALLRDRGTAVALCPRSNQRLDCGQAPVAAYRAEGNPVGIGTDSLSSSPSLDLLDEVRAVRALAVSQGSAEDGLDRWLVEAMTLGGATAVGRNDIGRLEPGARADLAILDVSGDDPYAAIVAHGAGRCMATMVAGDLRHIAATD